MKIASSAPRSTRGLLLAALFAGASSLGFSADQTITGNLTVTGTTDIDGNTLTLGTQSSSPGLSLTYADANADTLTFYLNRNPGSFLWAHTSAIAAMRLTANHEIILYKSDGTTAGLTLTPATSTISLGATTLYRDSGTGALRTNGAFTVDGAISVAGNITAPNLAFSSGTLTGGSNGLTLSAGTADKNINLQASGTGSVFSTAPIWVSVSNATNLFGILAEATKMDNAASSGRIYGVRGRAMMGNETTANLTKAFSDQGGGLGNDFEVVHFGEGTITGASVVNGRIRSQGAASGTIVDAAIFRADSPTVTTGKTITNLYGFYGAVPTTLAGTISNHYGLYLESPTLATNNWAIYSLGGTSFLGGQLRLGSGTNHAGEQLQVTGAAYVSGATAIGGNLGVTGSVDIGAAAGYKQAGVKILHATADSTFIGAGAGNTTHTANNNSAIGNAALATVTTGSDNVAIGTNALTLTTEGFSNVGIGLNALSNNTVGTRNIAIGRYALTANSEASDNLAIGDRALNSNDSGNRNVAIGKNAGVSSTTGENNLYLGYNAAFNATTGSNNIVIGYNLHLPSATNSNQLTIGNLIFGTGINGTETTVSTGNIGIGNAAPAYKLDVTGDINFTGTLRQNGVPFSSGGGSSQWTTSGSSINYSGDVGLGVSSPVAKLDVAGYVNTDASSGYKQAGQTVLDTTANSVFVGRGAGNKTNTGNGNTAVGQMALTAVTTGTTNAALGALALQANTTGVGNLATGAWALMVNTSGARNTAVGRGALISNTSGGDNTALGAAALGSNETGGSNVALGYQAGLSTTGSTNIFIGTAAGKNVTTGSNNLIVGHNIDAPSATASNQLNIGNLIYGTGVDGTGTTLSAGNIGIGTATPSATEKLEVNGNTKVIGKLTAASGRFDGPVRIAPQGDLPMGSFTTEP